MKRLDCGKAGKPGCGPERTLEEFWLELGENSKFESSSIRVAIWQIKIRPC
jgi:hypothetical protein